MIRGRLKSREIVQWVLQNYIFEGGHSIEAFYWSYLAFQTRALSNGMVFAESDDIYSANGYFITAQLQQLIRKTFLGSDQFWERWELYSDVETFAWPSTDIFVVGVKHPQNRTSGMSISAFGEDVYMFHLIAVDLPWKNHGYTGDDEAWISGSVP